MINIVPYSPWITSSDGIKYFVPPDMPITVDQPHELDEFIRANEKTPPPADADGNK